MARSELKLLNWNARSVARKEIELLHLLESRNTDLVIITETHLKPAVKFRLPGYTVVRLDRTSASGGGVAIAVKTTIKFRVLPHYNTKIIEALGIELDTDRGKLCIIAVYCPRQCSDKNGSSSSFKNDLAKLTHNRRKLIVAGDLNARHENWGNHRRNKNGTILFGDSQAGYYTVSGPRDPTFISPAGVPSTLDLFLTNAPDHLSDPETVKELSSDHFPVEVVFRCSPTTRPDLLRKDYHNVNWVEFQRRVDRLINPDVPLRSIDDVDHRIEELVGAIQAAEEACVPRVPVNVSKPELDRVTLLLIRKRNSFKRKFQRTGRVPQKILASKLTKIIHARIDDLKNDKFSRDIERMDPRSRPFWKVAKILKSKPQQVPPLKLNDSLLITHEEKANAIGAHFVSSHNLGSTIVSPLEGMVQESIQAIANTPCYVPANKKITVDEVRLSIRQSKKMKAPGFDAIFNLVLKNISERSIVHLVCILNKCLELQYFPAVWKCAKVIPIPKPGKDLTLPSSYRPISLLSSLSKLFERAILSRLTEHIEINNIVPAEQFGFRRGHSTTQQLSRVTNHIKRNIHVSKSTVMALLDVEKAFDNVWHEGLLHKLYRYNFPLYLIKVVKSYLDGRTFKVYLNGVLSESFVIPAGVPQGSLVGPALYNVYTSDVPHQLEECHVSLYADDTAIMVKGRNTRHLTNKIQEALNSLARFMNDWKIKINAAKTQTILFPYSRSPRLKPPDDCRVIMNNQPIEWSDEVVYLGLTLDSKMIFKPHIEKISTKCNILLKKLYPIINRNSKLNIVNKHAVYRQIILPTILYASPIWESCAITHKKKLQIVQNKFLKMIHNLPRHTRTTSVHEIAQIGTIIEQISATKEKYIQKCNQSEFAAISNLFGGI